MALRREKGLCYNCDETFTPQHKCKGRFFLLITKDPPDPNSEILNITLDSFDFDTINPHNKNPIDAQISLHALSGCTTTSTIRLRGHISNHPVIVLIDEGSTQISSKIV